MRLLRGLVRFVYRLAAWVGVFLILLAVFFTQTTSGREKVLREVLTRVQGAVRGEVMVERISSSGLLRGFTFIGVSIQGEDEGLFSGPIPSVPVYLPWRFSGGISSSPGSICGVPG